jgi:hypothetical protein
MRRQDFIAGLETAAGLRIAAFAEWLAFDLFGPRFAGDQIDGIHDDVTLVAAVGVDAAAVACGACGFI